MRCIVAIGGGGFMMEDTPSPIDDGAAFVYTEGRIERIVRWQPGRTAYHVAPGTHRVAQTALDAEALPS